MEGTHIRFALDLKDRLGITDVESYIIGAVYPDSRYITKLDRDLTHPKKYKENMLSKDDFHKGWFTHLLCDDVQYEVIEEMFPEIETEILGKDSDGWINRTSVKLLQDINDVRQFNIKETLGYLDSARNPNGEDKEGLRKYNNLLRTLYERAEKVDLDSYSILWKKFGLNEELGNKLMERAHQNLNDADFVKKINKIYDKVLEKSLNELN